MNSFSHIADEHTKLIREGASSLDIAVWLGEELGISGWSEKQFLGQLNILPTPRQDAIGRLQGFIESFGISWTRANGGSDNYPEFLLLDGYVQNALFGQKNMQKVEDKFREIDAEWKKIEDKYAEKEKYLQTQFGLNIHSDWRKLTGVRIVGDGGFDISFGFYASGALDGHMVHRLWLFRDGSDVSHGDASIARLCFLV